MAIFEVPDTDKTSAKAGGRHFVAYGAALRLMWAGERVRYTIARERSALRTVHNGTDFNPERVPASSLPSVAVLPCVLALSILCSCTKSIPRGVAA